MKRIFITCLSIGASMLFISGCGKKARAPISESIAVDSALEASDAVSTEDFAEATAGGIEGISPLSLAPMSLEPSQNPPPDAVLIYLNPNILKARAPLLRAIRAPLDILRMFKDDLRYCSISGPCPDPEQPLQYNSCTVTCNLSGAKIIVPVYGSLVEISLDGTLSGTIEGGGGTLPKSTATAVNMKLTGPEGRWLKYNGSVTWELTGAYITGASWVLSTSDLSADDSSGAKGTASGTRVVEVEFGRLWKARNNGVLTFTPPGSDKAIRLDVSINRTITIDGLTKTISINDTITTDGIVRTLFGTLTITKEEDANGKLEGIYVNGSITRSGPRGSLTVTFKDVYFKVNCDNNPWGGSIEVTNGQRTFIVDFREDCGCIVDVTRPDGSKVEFNTCERRVIGKD